MKLKDVIINANDNSVKEYKKDILTYLISFHTKMSTEAMSMYQLYLQGRKNMLNEIIEFIKRN